MSKQRFFYLKQNGRIFGPFPAAHILKLFRSDALQTEDEISVDKVNWKNALQFFNVPDDTVLPFELTRKQEDTAAAITSASTLKPAPSALEVPIRRNYASMQHLYIIFAAFMLITCIAAFILPSQPAETQNTPSNNATLFDMSRSGNSTKKLSDLAPPAAETENSNNDEIPAEDEKKTAPLQVRKASAAFILTLFSNFD